MTKCPHLVTLNTEDGSEHIWKDLFEGKSDFSEWVRFKLNEEKQKRLDKSYIYKQISDAESQVEFWKKQLNKADEIQQAKKQKEEQPDLEENKFERDFDVLVRKIGMYLQYQFITEDYEIRDIWEKLAREYLNTCSNMEILSFLESKGYERKAIKKRSVELFTSTNLSGGESN